MTARSGRCRDTVSIYCGSTLYGDTLGRSGYLSDYTCASRPTTGPEIAYRLDNPISGSITVTMTPHQADLDLIVAGARPDGGCNPTGRCMASSQNSGMVQEQVTMDATRGETYYFLVDGFGGAKSAYTIHVDCNRQ